MPEVISVSPFRCRMWPCYPRLEERINEKTCRAEIDSFLTHGQRLPVLGRPLKADRTHDFELVYGARRLFVARHLNLPLALELRELTDQEAVVALDIENRQRKDLSSYERGRAYDMWIRSGLFSSQDELAKALRISPSRVSRLVRFAQLPPVIVNVFSSPLEIRETWGRRLMDLWENPQMRQALVHAAEAIARESPRRPADGIFKRLLAIAVGTGQRVVRNCDAGDEVVRDENGRALFRVRRHRDDTVVLLPTESISRRVLSEITHGVAEILMRARCQSPRCAADSGGFDGDEMDGPKRVFRIATGVISSGS